MMLCPIRLQVNALTMSPLPIDLALIKTHCKIDGTDLDDNIEVYLKAAIEWAEGEMHRSIFSRSHTWVLRDFPIDGRMEIRLPRGKTQSIESIVYQSNGSPVTLTGPSSGSPAGTSWQEDLRGDDGAILLPPRGSNWPSVDYDAPAPVAINFTAGWLAAEVPAEIIHAILFSISDAIDISGTADLMLGDAVQMLRDAGHGDLAVMGGACQRTWEHAVPKTSAAVGPRISIQYRVAGVR